ncbi:MAG: hypothetical protein IVW53_05160 [Chloroflexi bacterium]|nr:hypothetical protein [Chloroflexota bacterium]
MRELSRRQIGVDLRSRAAVVAFIAVALALVVGACTVGPGAGGSIAGGRTVPGTVLAGPTCPVQRVGDSGCADRPVAGAVLVVTTPSGTEIARVTSDAGGAFSLSLAPGDYLLVPQPVAGLMITPRPLAFSVAAAGAASALDVRYDTGIR